MPPPSSGGLATLEILGLLRSFDMSAGPRDIASVHRLAEACRLAFADRNQYVSDSDFVSVPVQGLLDKGYLAERGLNSPSDIIGKVEKAI